MAILSIGMKIKAPSGRRMRTAQERECGVLLVSQVIYLNESHVFTLASPRPKKLFKEDRLRRPPDLQETYESNCQTGRF